MRLKRLGLPAFLLTLILLCSISVHTLYKIRDYGTLINYVRIVRGASQRLVKLELTDQPNDELKDYIDEILTELDMGVGKYSLINLNDEDYRTDLNKLKNIWEERMMWSLRWDMSAICRSRSLALMWSTTLNRSISTSASSRRQLKS